MPTPLSSSFALLAPSPHKTSPVPPTAAVQGPPRFPLQELSTLFLVLAPWWRSQESDRAKIHSRREAKGVDKFQVNYSSSYETCLVRRTPRHRA
jgi:hypothetical protein